MQILKKAAAAVLAMAMAAGFTGCFNSEKKNIDAVIKVTDQYVEALSNFDAEGVLELTNWDEDDEQYQEVSKLLDLDFYSTQVTKEEIEYYKYIASTITYSSDDGRITLEDDEATLKIQYKLVNWKPIFAETYDDFDEVLKALKDCDDTITVKETLNFKKEKDGWKLTKISKLGEAFSFVYALPNVILEPQPTGDEPSTSESSSQVSDLYKEAREAYLYLLGTKEAAIRKAEKIYGKSFCNYVDLNGDSVPELLFVSADKPDDDNSSASLHIYEYNEYAGEPIEVITINEIAYTAEGGSFFIFTTASNLVITTHSGESSNHHVVTYVYDLHLALSDTYQRDEHYSYDPNTDKETTTYEYYQATKTGTVSCDESIYKNAIQKLVDKVVLVVGYDYLPVKDSLEYAINNAIKLPFESYDDVIAEIKAEG